MVELPAHHQEFGPDYGVRWHAQRDTAFPQLENYSVARGFCAHEWRHANALPSGASPRQPSFMGK